MSASLIGIIFLQIFWIKWSVSLDEKNFDAKVTRMMDRVRERILEDVKTYDPYTKNYFKSPVTGSLLNNPGTLTEPFLNGNERWHEQQLNYELNSLRLLFDPSFALENISPQHLDTIIKQELKDQGIDLYYDYGVYSKEMESYVILNGNFVATIGDSKEASIVEKHQGLHNSKYKISLVDIKNTTKGFLTFFFPSKTTWLWSSVWPIVLSSILFTGLILFCFVYTIYVIFRQKKISSMKTDFINNMTHEFKTPIATISLATDSIINPIIIENKEKVERFARIIKEENKRMLNQVEKVLQMALIDKKDFVLKRGDVDMHEIILQAVNNMNLTVQKREGSIITTLKAKDAVIQGDITHLSNIIHNLLDNANKYSPDKPELEISTRNTEDRLEVIVSDKGMGMSKEAVKHIFEKFYRVHTGDIHDVKGFGLGLTYVKALVDTHDGEIKVTSESGKGSNFMLYFPLKLSDQ